MNFSFWNYPPWSLLIAQILLQHVSYNLFASFLNSGYASFIECRKRVQVNLEKSSTTTKAYKFPPRLIVLEGPNKSMCKSSRGYEVETQFFKLKDFVVCFPFDKPHTHVPSRTWVWVSHEQVHLKQVYLNYSYECVQFFYAKAMIPHVLLEKKPIDVVRPLTNEQNIFWIWQSNLTRIRSKGDLISSVTELTDIEQAVL